LNATRPSQDATRPLQGATRFTQDAASDAHHATSGRDGCSTRHAQLRVGPVRAGARGEVRRRCRGGFSAQPAEDSRRVHVRRADPARTAACASARARGRMRIRAHARGRCMGATCRCDASCCVAIDLPHCSVSAGRWLQLGTTTSSSSTGSTPSPRRTRCALPVPAQMWRLVAAVGGVATRSTPTCNAQCASVCRPRAALGIAHRAHAAPRRASSRGPEGGRGERHVADVASDTAAKQTGSAPAVRRRR
jgi:hypothetical protein